MSTERITGFPTIFPEGGLARNDATANFQLGQIAMDIHGNLYRYVKANEALAIGQTVTHIAKAAMTETSALLTAAAVASGATQIPFDGNASATAAIAKDKYAGFYVSQATAAAKGIGYRIKGHAAVAANGVGYLDLEDAVAEAFADNTALLIFNPHLIELTDATTELICGVAIGTISAGYYGFVQVGGYCRRVAVGHSTSAAIVLDEPLTPLASPEGSVQGMAGGDEADVMEAAASPLIALQAVGANTTGYASARFSRVV